MRASANAHTRTHVCARTYMRMYVCMLVYMYENVEDHEVKHYGET